MNIIETPGFIRIKKKLHPNQKPELLKAIQANMENPEIGELKIGILAGVRVYKFRLVKQQILLAYIHEKESATLILRYLGSHENFYRDLARTV